MLIQTQDILNVNRDMLDRILDRIRGVQSIQVVGHVRPDGDCIGSLLGMHHMLDQLGIQHALAARAISPNGYTELADYDMIRGKPDESLNPDLYIYLDCASLERGIEGQDDDVPIINIDHHGSNTRYGEINWIEPDCAAVGEMLFYLASHAGLNITPVLAEALLVALTTDTGAFCFSNTHSIQHRIAACLIDAGASSERIYRMAYCSQSVEGVRLSGIVLSRLRLGCGGKLAWSEVRSRDYEQVGGEGNAPENLANSINTIRGVHVSLLFHEMDSDGLRLNLRSDGFLDVSRVAARWGGGGHSCAAGLQVRTDQYEKTRDEILNETVEILETASPDPGG
jgi:phosphoesterase RecJ-like protein